MDARDIIKVGMSAERMLVVPPERTVGYLVQGMPMVFATPMMILEMEMASGDAIRGHLPPGWVTVGTEVDVRPRREADRGRIARQDRGGRDGREGGVRGRGVHGHPTSLGRRREADWQA